MSLLQEGQGGEKKIVGQISSHVKQTVYEDDVDIAEAFLNRSGYVCGTFADFLNDVIEAVNVRSEEKSFQEGKKTL